MKQLFSGSTATWVLRAQADDVWHVTCDMWRVTAACSGDVRQWGNNDDRRQKNSSGEKWQIQHGEWWEQQRRWFGFGPKQAVALRLWRDTWRQRWISCNRQQRRVQQGKRYNRQRFGFGPKWQLRRWQERWYDDDTVARTDDDRGLQLQNNTHNDEGYRVCVRIHTLGLIRWPRRMDGCEPGPNVMGLQGTSTNYLSVGRTSIYQN